MTSRINDNTSSLKDASLSVRVEKITEALSERKQLVEEGSQVLRAAAESLKGVKAKYEPVKTHSTVLVSTSKNATSCCEEVSRLLACLKVHEKVRYCLLHWSTASSLPCPRRGVPVLPDKHTGAPNCEMCKLLQHQRQLHSFCSSTKR